jgi:uncharacterized protein (TIGR04255 family)
MQVSTASGTRKRPVFERPPVVETVMGIQFQPIPGFGNCHLGAFWKRLGPDWPTVIDAAPLEPQYEKFGQDQSWAFASIQLKLLQTISLRAQIKNRSNDRMIQVQNGRFHYNWLGSAGQPYPRYEKEIKPAFDQKWAEFQRFVVEELQTVIQPDQWEITYVNRFPKGTVWTRLEDDLPDFLRIAPALALSPAGNRLDSFEGEWHYEIPPQRGRLHVQLKHGRELSADKQEAILMTLTARGQVASDGDFEAGLNLGHDAIVNSFVDLTSESAHAYWGVSYA